MEPVKSTPIIIVEGIHGLYDERLRALMDLKIFVLTPDDIRLSRRSKYKQTKTNLFIFFTVQRDIIERGREIVDVLGQYTRFVKPAYDQFIKPMMFQADIIVPFKTKNDNAVQMLVQNLKVKLQRSYRISEFGDEPSPFLKKDSDKSKQQEEQK